MICRRDRMKAGREYNCAAQAYGKAKGETHSCGLRRGCKGGKTMKGYTEYNTHIEYDDFGEYEEELEM